MASGCILGKCPICNDHIWEDEWDMYADTILHERCKREFIENSLKITNGQFEKLSKEQDISKEIECLKKEMNDTFEYYSKRIKALELQLK